MMTQLLLNNLRFGINMLGALAFFCVFWLYFDAWKQRKKLKELIKLFGFLSLSATFMLQGVGQENVYQIGQILKVVGYFLVGLGVFIEPLEQRPTITFNSFLPFVVFIAPPAILPAFVAIVYLRKVAVGLENHLKMLGVAFLLLSVAESLDLSKLFQTSTNIDIANLVSVYGPFWIIQSLVYLAGFLILIRWSFSYLLKRFQTQIFILFIVGALTIYLAITAAFTTILINNLKNDTLNNLKSNTKVLRFTLNSKQESLLAKSQFLTNNPQIISAIINSDQKELSIIAESALLNNKFTSLVILDEKSIVLARGEDKDRIGDSFTSDQLVKRVLLGEPVSTIDKIDTSISQELEIRVASPIKNNSKIIGIILVSEKVDKTFLDGLKKETGYEASLVAQKTIIASTLPNSNHWIGMTVPVNQLPFSGTVKFGPNEYLTSFAAINGIDNETVGMISAAIEENKTFETAQAAIKLTFLITTILMLFSLIPAYLISKYLSDQVK